MSKELFSLRVCQLYNALCFGYTQGGAGVSKKRLRLSYLELRRNSDVALLNTENLRVRALAPHIYYSTEGNKGEGGWEGEREDDPAAAAEEPRVSSWDVLDMSSLDLIPKLLAAFTEIRLQPERRRLKQENIVNSAGRHTDQSARSRPHPRLCSETRHMRSEMCRCAACCAPRPMQRTHSHSATSPAAKPSRNNNTPTAITWLLDIVST